MAQRPNVHKPKDRPAQAPARSGPNAPAPIAPKRGPPPVPARVPPVASKSTGRGPPPLPPRGTPVNQGGFSFAKQPSPVVEQNSPRAPGGKGFLRKFAPWLLGLGLLGGAGYGGVKYVGSHPDAEASLREWVGSKISKSVPENDFDRKAKDLKLKYLGLLGKVRSNSGNGAALASEFSVIESEYASLRDSLFEAKREAHQNNIRTYSPKRIPREYGAAEIKIIKPYLENKTAELPLSIATRLHPISPFTTNGEGHWGELRTARDEISTKLASEIKDVTLAKNLDSLLSAQGASNLLTKALADKGKSKLDTLTSYLNNRRLAIRNARTISSEDDAGNAVESEHVSYSTSKEELAAFRALHSHLSEYLTTSDKDILAAADAYASLTRVVRRLVLPKAENDVLNASLEALDGKIKQAYSGALRAPPRLVQLQNGSLLVQLGLPNTPFKTYAVREFAHNKQEELNRKTDFFSSLSLHGLIRPGKEGSVYRYSVAKYNLPFEKGVFVIKPEHVAMPSALALTVDTSLGAHFYVPGGVLTTKGFDSNASVHTAQPSKYIADEEKNVDDAINRGLIVLDRELQPDGTWKVVLKSGQHLVQPATAVDEENARRVLAGEKIKPVISDNSTPQEEYANPEVVPDDRPSLQQEDEFSPSEPLPGALQPDVEEPEPSAPGTSASIDRLNFDESNAWSKLAHARNLRPRTAGMSPFGPEGKRLRERRTV